MAAEIYGKNPDNTPIIAAVAEGVFRILEANGMPTVEAHSAGRTGAVHVAGLLLATMELTGDIGRGQVSDDDFAGTLAKVVEATLNPSNVATIFGGDEMEASHG